MRRSRGQRQERCVPKRRRRPPMQPAFCQRCGRIRLHYVEPTQGGAIAGVVETCRVCGFGTLFPHEAGVEEWTP